MHVAPAADGAAEEVGEGGVLVREADGADERRSLHTTAVLFLQFDQNCTKQTWRSREGTKEEAVDQGGGRSVQGIPMSCSVGLNTENCLGKMYLSTPNVLEL